MNPPPPTLVRRLRLVQATLFGLLVALVVALVQAQWRRTAEAVDLERRQSLRQMMLPGARGIISDRAGRVLAGNRDRLDAVLHWGRVREELGRISGASSEAPAAIVAPPAGTASLRRAIAQRELDRINAIIGRTTPLNVARLERHFSRERTSPFVLVADLTEAEAQRRAGALRNDDPVQLVRTAQRWYPHGRTAAHVLGRLRRETVRTPPGEAFPILNYTTWVGDWGLERQHERQLQGRPGHAIIRVDAVGLPVGEPLEQHEAEPGGDLVLSIDLELQQAAERAMAATPGQPRGAAVALSVVTGEVLVLVSKPDFDLNAVSPVLTAEMQEAIDAEGGWLNRATQGLYPPGSSFKIFTMLAGLRAGTLQPDDRLSCPGYYDVAGHRFRCHRPDGHGEITLRTALAQSCNVFAYQVGLAAGPRALAEEANRFHFGEPSGIDLPFETRRMLVPDPTRDAARWNLGDTVNLAIGQGDLRFTPLQAACAIASLARRETLTVPTLLHSPDRRPTGERPAEPLNLDDDDYAALIDGLQAVVETGIGRDARVPGVAIAGKTGTAQVLRPEGMMNIAWFVAFAPVERPEIAVAVAMEGDQPNVEFAGAEHAAPIVREIIGTHLARPR